MGIPNDTLNKVLRFGSELIILSLKNEKPDESKVNEVRKSCDELSKSGVYQFDTNCSNEELFDQIQSFSTHING